MKVLWLHRNTDVVTFNPEEHTYDMCKFLFWKGSGGSEDLLVAAPLNPLIQWHRQVHSRFKEHVPNRTPDAAGTVSPIKRGGVRSWTSADLGVETPRELRSLLLDVLWGRKLVS